MYGSCIAQTCGRFVTQISEEHMQLLEEIANNIYYSVEENAENTTVLAMDLSTRNVSFDVEKTQTMQFQDKIGFQHLVEKMVDLIGYQIRKKVRNLFDLDGKLWIAR